MIQKNSQKEISNKTLALFFTFGVSLKTWYEAGLIIRDTALYNEISKDLKHIYFFTYGDKEDLEFKKYLADNITIVPIPFKSLKLLYPILLPIIHYKILRNVDIIKSHQMWGGMVAVLCKILFRKKNIARCGFMPSRGKCPERNIIKRIVLFLNDMLVCRFSNIICVPNKGEAEYINKKFKVSKNKIVINPNWIDTNRFYPFENIEKIKNRICFLARFEPIKQPLLLIEALKDLKNIELLMIGGGSLDAEIRKKIKEYNIKAKVIGRIKNEELPIYLNSCEIYIILSLGEGGSPKTLLEAMACGLPVIGTNVDGINEVIEQGKNGILCNNDLNSVKESITSLIGNKELKRKLVGNARKTILEKFSLEKILEKEKNIYETL